MANTLKFGNGEWYGKKDTILAYNDENSNYKPLPFDFSRASSATVVNQSGLIETVGSGEPRIDFKDNTKGALLLEPSRTNLFQYSEDFGQGYWTKFDSSAVSGFTSPDGGLNASLLKGNGVGSFPRVQSTVSGSGQISFSVFVKKELSDVITLRVNGTGIGGGADASSAYTYTFSTDSFLITEGGTVDSSESTSFGNGWVRLTLNYTTTTITGLRIYPVFNSTNTDGVYIYGAQYEVGSYATSYIPTQGSTVTRLAESCVQTVPDGVIGQTEGTLFLDFKKEHNGLETWSINDGTSSNRVYMGFNGTNFISQVRSSGGAPQASFSTSLNNDTRYKCALAYKLNDFVLYINGVQIGTDNIGVVPLNMSKLSAYASTSSDAPFFSPTNDIKLYNTRLSNSELQALTS